ncbi:unnamed protein product, partial [Mesorhabditis spiculigera]
MTPIPTEGELLRFGSLNIMLSVGGICLQIWYIKFLYARRPGWGRDIVLTLHLLSAFCDIVQLSAHGFAGLQMFFPEAPLPYSRFFGGLIIGGWINGTLYMNYFVLHRFLFVYLPFTADQILTPLVNKIYIVFTFMCFLLHMGCSVSIYNVTYNATQILWKVANTDKGGYEKLILEINEYSNYVFAFFCLPFYVAIIGMVLYRKKRMRAALKSRDIYIICQMMLSWALGMLCWIVWEIWTPKTDPPVVAYLKKSLSWIGWNCYKPLSTLITLSIKPSWVTGGANTNNPARGPNFTLANFRAECHRAWDNSEEFRLSAKIPMDDPATVATTVSPTVIPEYAIFGCIEFAVAAFFIGLQLWYFRYLLSKKPDWGKGVVVILFLLTAVCDVFQLIAHCYVALAMIFPVTLEPYCGYFGSLLLCGWMNAAFYMSFFVVNRFVHVYFPFQASRILQPWTAKLFVALSAVLFGFILYSTVFLLTVVRRQKDWKWSIDLTRPENRDNPYAVAIKAVANYMPTFFDLPFYVALIIMIIWRRQRAPRDFLRPREILVILQMLCSWLLRLGIWSSWHIFVSRSDPAVIKFLGKDMLWLVWNGFKPASTILMLWLKPTRLFSILVQRRHRAATHSITWIRARKSTVSTYATA